MEKPFALPGIAVNRIGGFNFSLCRLSWRKSAI